MTQRINVLTALEQKRLYHSASLCLAPHQARRHHAGLIDDQQITWLDVIDDVAEDAMLDRPTVLQCHGICGVAPLTIKYKQTTRVARIGRCLGDKFLRQGVIKIIGTHGHDWHPL